MSRASLTFTFNLQTPDRIEKTEGDNRERFWRNLVSLARETAPRQYREKRDYLEPDALERDFKQNFGPRLTNQLRAFQWSRSGPYERGSEGLVAFAVRRVSYGSLIADVDVLNPQKLVEYFVDEDVTIAILNQFAVSALSEGVQRSDGSSYYMGEVTGVDVSAVPSPELKQQFDKGKRANKAESKLPIWNAMNQSLLVPLILALIVLGVAFNSITEERREVAAERLAIVQHDEAILAILADVKNREFTELQERVTRLEQSTSAQQGHK